MYSQKETPLKFIGEMDLVNHVDKEGNKIFNGTLGSEYRGQKILLKLLGDEKENAYLFNDLFSKPMTAEFFEAWRQATSSTKKPWSNVIIINAPHEVEDVVIDVHPEIRELLNLPKTIPLVDVAKNKIALFPEKTTFAEKLAHGVDPLARTFFKSINFNLEPILQKNLDADILRINQKIKFSVKCYFISILKELLMES